MACPDDQAETIWLGAECLSTWCWLGHYLDEAIWDQANKTNDTFWEAWVWDDHNTNRTFEDWVPGERKFTTSTADNNYALVRNDGSWIRRTGSSGEPPELLTS